MVSVPVRQPRLRGQHLDDISMSWRQLDFLDGEDCAIALFKSQLCFRADRLADQGFDPADGNGLGNRTPIGVITHLVGLSPSRAVAG